MTAKIDIERLQTATHRLWAQANILNHRITAGQNRLRSFPLWKRLLFYWRFQRVRAIIQRRINNRLYVVFIACMFAKQLSKAKVRQGR